MVKVGQLILYHFGKLLLGLLGCSRTGFIELRQVLRGLRQLEVGRGGVLAVAVAAEDFRVGIPCHAPLKRAG